MQDALEQALVYVRGQLAQSSPFDPLLEQWMRMHQDASDTNIGGGSGGPQHPCRRLEEVCLQRDADEDYSEVVKRLLEPTQGGVSFVLREMDRDNDGIVASTHAFYRRCL